MKLTPAFLGLIGIVAATVVSLAALHQLPPGVAGNVVVGLLGMLIPTRYNDGPSVDGGAK